MLTAGLAFAVACTTYGSDDADGTTGADGGADATIDAADDGGAVDASEANPDATADAGAEAFRCQASDVLCDDFEGDVFPGAAWTRITTHGDAPSGTNNITMAPGSPARSGGGALRIEMNAVGPLNGMGLMRDNLPQGAQRFEVSFSLRARRVLGIPATQLAALHFSPPMGSEETRVIVALDRNRFVLFEQQGSTTKLTNGTATVAFDDEDYLDLRLIVDLKNSTATFSAEGRPALTIVRTLELAHGMPKLFDIGLLYTPGSEVLAAPVELLFDDVRLR